MTCKKLSISKVFWNTATPTRLCIIYGYFFYYNGKIDKLPKNIYWLTFYGKRLPISSLHGEEF